MTHREALPWVGAAIVALHNLEEALVTPEWLRQHSAALHARLGRPVPHFSKQELYIAIALVTLFSVAWIAAAFRSSPRSLGAYSLATLFGIYFINAFVPHIVGALVFKGYVPGLLTASFAVVPFTIFYVSAGVRAGRYTTRGIGIAFAVAFLLYSCLGIALQLSLAARSQRGCLTRGYTGLAALADEPQR